MSQRGAETEDMGEGLSLRNPIGSCLVILSSSCQLSTPQWAQRYCKTLSIVPSSFWVPGSSRIFAPSLNSVLKETDVLSSGVPQTYLKFPLCFPPFSTWPGGQTADSRTLRTDNVNPCDTTLLTHHQPIIVHKLIKQCQRSTNVCFCCFFALALHLLPLQFPGDKGGGKTGFNYHAFFQVCCLYLKS